MKQWLKELRRRYQSFMLWAPVLFSDRWFDSNYLLAIIERKCRYDARMYQRRGHGMDNYLIAGDLSEVADICQRLQSEDEYWEPEYSQLQSKWEDKPLLCQGPAEREEFLAISKLVGARMQKDVERLGELFKKIQDWSD